QTLGRAQGALLSIQADPAPRENVFSGLLAELGLSNPREQPIMMRGSLLLGVAGIHEALVHAVRCLIHSRRETAFRVGTAAAVAASSGTIVHRRFNEFVFEVELQRSGGIQLALSRLRRLLESILFWMPLHEREREEDANGGEGNGKRRRGKLAGNLPRELAGHEKSALSQFQVTCLFGGKG
ncbi:unnamed protein product, partial [Choristocarpus tenellus]